MATNPITPRRLVLADIVAAIRDGLATARPLRGVSLAYAAVFVALGLLLLGGVGAVGLSPLALPFAGGFMLVGPILLTGFFELLQRHEEGLPTRVADAFRAFARAPAALWSLALVCAFLFLIWITDAGILYSFTIGDTNLGYDLAWLAESGGRVLAFELWGALMGSVLAYMIFVVSAFSVPLIYEERAGLVEAISASARAVLGNFVVCLAWGLVLGSVILLSIVLLPALLWTLPVMSYASFHLYRRAFPSTS